MFDEFEFEILGDKAFNDASSRQELVSPMIKRLGCNLIGDNRVARSRSLVHPTVAIGSQQRKVSIAQDYLFLSEGKPL